MMQFGIESHSDKKPCRTCTDFKTWAKQQKTVYKAKSEVSETMRNASIEIC